MGKLMVQLKNIISCFLKVFSVFKSSITVEKHLKAATIIESIVAMTLIMIGFGIALLIFLNINKSDNSFQKFKAQLILREVAVFSNKEKKSLFDQKQIGEISIIQTLSDYPGYADIKLLKLEAFNYEGEKIADRKELILNDID